MNANTSHSQPAAGALWRAEWRTAAALVVLLHPEREGRSWRVCMADGEPAGDEHTLHLTGPQPDWPLTLNVWAGITASIPSYALHTRVGSLSSANLTAVLRNALEHEPAFDYPPISNEILDDRAAHRDHLTAKLTEVAEARWPMQKPSTSIRELAEREALPPSAVRAALSVSIGAARRILTGAQHPTAEQAKVLADLLNVHTSTVEAGAVPETVPGLSEAITSAAGLASIRQHHRHTSAAVLDDVAQQTYAFAARERTQQPDWLARLTAALDADQR